MKTLRAIFRIPTASRLLALAVILTVWIITLAIFYGIKHIT